MRLDAVHLLLLRFLGLAALWRDDSISDSEASGGAEMMELLPENPECLGKSAGSAAARTSCDVPQRLHASCDGCIIRNCLYRSDQLSALRRIKGVEFEANAVLYREGQSGTNLYVIRSGLVKLVQYSSNGSARIVRLLHSGNVIGLEALLGRVYHHTAVMLTDTVICLISTSVCNLLSDLDPSFRKAMMGCWQDQLDTADLWICGFSTGPAQVRLARLIRYLSSIEVPVSNDEVKLLCREDMASILGLAYESICREVSKLRSFGALRQVGAGRYACNAVLLEEISDDHWC